MNIGKFWSIFYFICLVLFIAAIIVLATGLLNAFEWYLAVLIPIIFVSGLGHIIAFAGMKYFEYGGCEFSGILLVIVEYWFTLCGGLGAWGIVTAIRILADKIDD